MDGSQAAAVAPERRGAVTAALEEARERTLALVAPFSEEDLERVHSTLMSPLVWDLGHIAAFEDLWLVHRYGGRPLLREELADVYDAFETPRAGRGDLPLLGPAEAREYLAEVRERTLEVLADRGTGDGVIARADRPPRAAAQRDDAPDDPARPAARAGVLRPMGRRSTAGAGARPPDWS